MNKKITRQAAEAAVKTLLSYIGEDASRADLLDTPCRVIDAYGDFFKGYSEDPQQILSKTFEEISGYEDIVLLKNMRFESHCEHHMVPMVGVAHIAYLPDKKVVGLSKLARILDVFAKRLQSQETMTDQIVRAIESALAPKGVAVLIDAKHLCMTTRGVHKPQTSTATQKLTGIFKTDRERYRELLSLIHTPEVTI